MTDLNSRLRNWGRVVRFYETEPHGRCFSIEGGWRSPQHWHPEEPRPPSPDVRDAWHVENGVQVLRARSQAVLRGRFVLQLRDPQLLRDLGMRKCPDWGLRSWADVDMAMIAARSELEAALLLPAVLRRRRAVELARALLPKPKQQEQSSQIIGYALSYA
jgi:hypothetical protein